MEEFQKRINYLGIEEMQGAEHSVQAARPVPNPESQTELGEVGHEEHAGPIHLLMEWVTALAFPVVFVWSLYLAGSHLYALELLWLVLLAIPIGIALGDLMSGVVHWAADTYGHDDTPLLGPSFIRAFRQHHVYPRDICSHNLVSVVGNTCIFAVPVLSLGMLVIWLGPVAWWRAFGFFTIAIMTGVTVATNQFHKWAHQERVSRLVAFLQQMRLVLAPDHHQLHHSTPFNSNYCITNGWLNPTLERIRFFRGLEATLRLVGIRPAVGKKY
jgi:ubiquitin-conjugating enzyme E2 variant